MHCSVRELCRRFSSQELSDEWTYYSIEPWGWRQDNLHFGVLASLAAPKSAQQLPGPENWFTDELPQRSLFDDEEE